MRPDRSWQLVLISLMFCLLIVFVPQSSIADVEKGGAQTDLLSQGNQTNSFITYIKSKDNAEIAIRVEYPSPLRTRYLDEQQRPASPVVVEVPGGHNPGGLSAPGDADSPLVQAGLIRIQLLFPGGVFGSIHSSGSYDYRGPKCQQALADVIRYAAGEQTDTRGKFLKSRLPFARTDLVGAVGFSNGGNLLLKTVERKPEARKALDWIALWESPLGAQYVTLELGERGILNPYYQPGSCRLESCPWPDNMEGEEDNLIFDPDAERVIKDPGHQNNTRTIQGAFCIDQNSNGKCDAPGDFEFVGLGGPDPKSTQPLLYHSPLLTNLIAERFFDLPPTKDLKDWPDWLATPDQAQQYWNARLGITAIKTLPNFQSWPPIMILATEQDHAQATPDHPHVLVPLQTLIQNNDNHVVPFIRGNPDAVYLADLLGVSDAENIPELSAGETWTWNKTVQPPLLSKNIDTKIIVTAATLELSDRSWKGIQELNGNFFTAKNLDSLLYTSRP
ncbi:MAG: hypothetical protein QNJ42_19035 [Crocosphaera sp.]|nr:hypothetical protein [Crocosphaera sp.]